MSKRKIEKRQNSSESSGEEKSWQQMFIISEHWLSDVKFFSMELNFLHRLIDKYFMWLVDEKNIESTRKMASHLSKVEMERAALGEKLEDHMRSLANLIENPFSHDAQNGRDNHEKLEALMAAFAKDFRAIKIEVFALAERVVESEKVKHLIHV